MHLLAFAESIQLFPDGTIFLHIAMILVMIWVLNRTLYRPINKVLQSREKHHGGGGPTEADTIRKEAVDKESRYKTEMLDVRSKAYEMIESEQKSAAALREKELSEAKVEVAQTLEKGKAQIEKQTVEMHTAVRADAEKNADSIAAKVLKA